MKSSDLVMTQAIEPVYDRAATTCSSNTGAKTQNLLCEAGLSTCDEELCNEPIKEVVNLVVSASCQSTHQHLLVWVAGQRHLQLHHSSKPEAVR